MLTIDSLCWLCLQPLHIAHHGVCSVCIGQIPPAALLSLLWTAR